ncbi:TPA: hypothetical protein JD893_13940 [Citrobacter freundii]|uniref:hypothetical protein n=1 Tax=Citrobacter TaxID=544 RepID=UPI0006C91745|nr:MULTISPECIES: hypothetical protein [Citrobacter]KAA0552100.1 hypothetical protein F0329_18450 [Citrobacter werkmanii]MBD0821704.1 hypothetical protein [Citrobacter sp. C5_2]WNW57083.1 hypothetical protein RU414_10340 [Citrobacter freundii]HAU6422632.1 hypothetical protein [Citrobacter freundii]HAU6435646.1 hypothetical protein [Citrobacter freundii]
MSHEEMTPAEKYIALRKRHKKHVLQSEIANAKRFEAGEVASVNGLRSPYEIRIKRGRTAD